MAKYDWSACCAELRLADAILRDDNEAAVIIMREIGKAGQFLREEWYQLWPLFRDFRSTELFLKTYEEIYGHEFFTEVQREIVQKEEKGKASTSKQ